MEDYTKYTIEGAISLFITIMAYKLYKLRCNTSSKCCGDSLQSDGNSFVRAEVLEELCHYVVSGYAPRLRIPQNTPTHTPTYASNF